MRSPLFSTTLMRIYSAKNTKRVSIYRAKYDLPQMSFPTLKIIFHVPKNKIISYETSDSEVQRFLEK